MLTVNLVCVICSDFVEEGMTVTRCGHLYHNECLDMWLFRDISCPQCRCRHPDPRRVFPTTRGPNNARESDRLLRDMEDTQYRLRAVATLLRREKSRTDLLSKKLAIAESVVLFFKKKMMRYRRQALIAQGRVRQLSGKAGDMSSEANTTLDDNQLREESKKPEPRCLRSRTARLAAESAAAAAAAAAAADTPLAAPAPALRQSQRRLRSSNLTTT